MNGFFNFLSKGQFTHFQIFSKRHSEVSRRDFAVWEYCGFILLSDHNAVPLVETSRYRFENIWKFSAAKHVNWPLIKSIWTSSGVLNQIHRPEKILKNHTHFIVTGSNDQHRRAEYELMTASYRVCFWIRSFFLLLKIRRAFEFH